MRKQCEVCGGRPPRCCHSAHEASAESRRVVYTIDGEGATVGQLADALAIVADDLLATGRKRDAQSASAIAEWIDSARSGEWWAWRTPLTMRRALDFKDFTAVKSVCAGRVR